MEVQTFVSAYQEFIASPKLEYTLLNRLEAINRVG